MVSTCSQFVGLQSGAREPAQRAGTLPPGPSLPVATCLEAASVYLYHIPLIRMLRMRAHVHLYAGGPQTSAVDLPNEGTQLRH